MSQAVSLASNPMNNDFHFMFPCLSVALYLLVSGNLFGAKFYMTDPSHRASGHYLKPVDLLASHSPLEQTSSPGPVNCKPGCHFQWSGAVSTAG